MSERCRELEERLSPWRDGELDPDQAREVAEHVADCPLCQAKVSAWHEAEAALAGSAPSRSDLEWERLAQRVEEAIDADELERIAETLPAGEEPVASARTLGGAEDEAEQAAAAGSARAAAAPRRASPRPASSRPAPSRRGNRWWLVGSGLAAAALVVLFWPWFPTTQTVAPGPGALRERVGAAGRTDGTAREKAAHEPGKPDLLEEEVAAETLADLDAAGPDESDEGRARSRPTVDGMGAVRADEKNGRATKDQETEPREAEPREPEPEVQRKLAAPSTSSPASGAPGSGESASDAPAAGATGTIEEAAPLDHLEALGYAEGEEKEEAAQRDTPAAPAENLPQAASVEPAPAQGAYSFREVTRWMSSDALAVSEPDARANAQKSRISQEQAAAPEDALSTATPADALRLAHEARDAGDRERAREGYRLLAGDFPENTVREEAWYSWTELQTEDVRAGSGLGLARETAASLDAFRIEYPESRYSRGVLAARVFVWARLVELDPGYCDEAHVRVLDWQTGIEAAPLEVLRAVSAIADGCAR